MVYLQQSVAQLDVQEEVLLGVGSLGRGHVHLLLLGGWRPQGYRVGHDRRLAAWHHVAFLRTTALVSDGELITRIFFKRKSLVKNFN